MKSTGTQAFVNQLLACGLVFACATGGVGLGAVWMRHQISVTARANKDLEKQIEIIARRLADVNAEVATQVGPLALHHRNNELGLGLVPPRQTEEVAVNVAARLAEKRNSIFTDRPLPEATLARRGNP